MWLRKIAPSGPSTILSPIVARRRGAHCEAHRKSLRNLAASGIAVACYNFMPVLGWTRTDIAWADAHGGTCMRFDLVDFAAFDMHILTRSGALADFPEEICDEENRRFAVISAEMQLQLARSIFTVLCCDNLPDNGALLPPASSILRDGPIRSCAIGLNVGFPSPPQWSIGSCWPRRNGRLRKR